MPIDLHVHSFYSSDGELSIHAILDLCQEKGISTVAITDHNSVQGVSEAVKLGAQMGIDVIPGIEIDCCHNGLNLHLLGYYVDYESDDFTSLQENFDGQQRVAFSEKLVKLRGIGMHIDETEISKRSGGKVPPDELVAEVILSDPKNLGLEILEPYRAGGSRSDTPHLNFYWDMCSQGKKAYVPINIISLIGAIDLIKRNHGVSAIAHPGQNLEEDMTVIDSIIAAGVEGIEVFSSYHSKEEKVDFFYRKAQEHKLAMTCGSDFHGKYKPTIHLGVFPTCPITGEKIVQSLQDRRGFPK